MMQTNDKVSRQAAAPGCKIRYGIFNRVLSVPARLLICALAVLMFLVFVNPAQTALLGRATLLGTAFSGDGLTQLEDAESRMEENVHALEHGAAALNAAADKLAAGGEKAAVANAKKAASKAMEEASAAVESTLGVEVAALEGLAGEDSAAILSLLTAAAEKLAAVPSADAAEKENALYNAMDGLWSISGAVPELASQMDNAAMAISEAMFYEPAAQGDPSREEKLQEALTAAETAVAQVQTQLTAKQGEQAQAAARLEKLNPVYTQVREQLNAMTTALEGEDSEAAADVLRAGAAELLKAKDSSSIAAAELTLGQAAAIRTESLLYVVFVVVGLVGMVLSLGNNRMRKLGFPVLSLGALAALGMLLAIENTHGQIAANVANLRAAYGAAAMPEALAAAVSSLALDVPDALWVCLAVSGLTAVTALLSWATLPRAVEGAMHIDLCTIFQRLTRVLILGTGMMIFFPALNPGRVSSLINENASLFTVAISYGTITEKMEFALTRGVIGSNVFTLLMIGAAVVMLGILLNSAGACMSLGNNRMKKKGGYLLPMAGSATILAGLLVICSVYHTLLQETIQNPNVEKYLQPMLPGGIVFWAVAAVAVFACSFVSWQLLPDELEEKMEMEEKYRNFLMFLPVLLLTVVFCYLPIYGWRFAFFDYKIGDQLLLYDTVVDGVVTQQSNFVGLKWFAYLFQNAATRSDLIRVLRNTLVMSGLGIATSWLPIAFAVLLAEVRSSKFQRMVQTLTTIPNFISWVLVYAIAFAIFSTDGFINSFLRNVLGVVGANTDYLASADFIWLKMLLWGTWKGLGWSAIVYIAGIAGIDQQLYEAARVDGANRFQCIRHITIPGLMPTYMVMLLMSVAGMLSNGMDQYLVFENAINKEVIEVLDLYVYNIGIKSGLIPISTVVGVFKSLIGVTLLFGANGISKAVRGESII